MIKIVSGVLIQEDKVLLCLRANTLHYANHWAFPVGHVEAKENDVDALRRELFEELAIQVIESEYLATLYDNQQRIQHTVFQVIEWRGEVANNEPHLCKQVAWFDLAHLPQPLTPATQTILQGI